MSDRARQARRIAVIGLVAIGGWLVIFGLPPHWARDPIVRASYRTLVKAEYFAGPAVGIAGEEPETSKAFRALAARRNGSAFKYLLLTGTPAGRLYGLAGVRHTDPFFFRVAVQPFRVWPGEVQTQFGCVIQTESVRDVVVTKGENPVRLGRGENLADWWKRKSPRTTLDFDIIGGGYTSMFVDYEAYIRPAV
jgi:hypothetical protein